jgi:hypothetical protein
VQHFGSSRDRLILSISTFSSAMLCVHRPRSSTAAKRPSDRRCRSCTPGSTAAADLPAPAAREQAAMTYGVNRASC